MKKILVLILMAFVVNAVAFAQTYQEVVYLKNGSVIRGVIVEQIPSVSLKIQTADGSIFAYQMDEVEKITKELMVTQTSKEKSSKPKEHISYADAGYKLKKGYRGFVDFGFSYGIDGDWSVHKTEFFTTHGYQFLPYLFVGIGVGMQFVVRDPDPKNGHLENFHPWLIPVFGSVRGTLPCRSICQPFLDFNAGYSVWEATGFYMATSVGCRFAVSRMCGINLSIGYTMQDRNEKYRVRRYVAHDYVYTTEDKKIHSPALVLKIGIDF